MGFWQTIQKSNRNILVGAHTVIQPMLAPAKPLVPIGGHYRNGPFGLLGDEIVRPKMANHFNPRPPISVRLPMKVCLVIASEDIGAWGTSRHFKCHHKNTHP